MSIETTLSIALLEAQTLLKTQQNLNINKWKNTTNNINDLLQEFLATENVQVNDVLSDIENFLSLLLLRATSRTLSLQSAAVITNLENLLKNLKRINSISKILLNGVQECLAMPSEMLLNKNIEEETILFKQKLDYFEKRIFSSMKLMQQSQSVNAKINQIQQKIEMIPEIAEEQKKNDNQFGICLDEIRQQAPLTSDQINKKDCLCICSPNGDISKQGFGGVKRWGGVGYSNRSILYLFERFYKILLSKWLSQKYLFRNIYLVKENFNLTFHKLTFSIFHLVMAQKNLSSLLGQSNTSHLKSIFDFIIPFSKQQLLEEYGVNIFNPSVNSQDKAKIVNFTIYSESQYRDYRKMILDLAKRNQERYFDSDLLMELLDNQVNNQIEQKSQFHIEMYIFC